MRQLSLFKGQRQKGERIRPSVEFKTHCALADALRLSIRPGWLWFHTPNGGERSAFINRRGQRVSPEGGRLKRMGVLPGVSDFLLVAPPAGRLYALELKRQGEKPTEDQKAFLESVRAAGGVSAWADTFDDAIRQLAAWGAIRVAL